MSHTPEPFMNVEESMRPRSSGITFEVWGVTAPMYLNPAHRNEEQVYDAKTGMLYSTKVWGQVVLDRIRAAAPELLAALKIIIDRRACSCSQEKLCVGHSAIAKAEGRG